MKKKIIIFSSIIFLSACDMPACPDDSQMCPDGSMVMRDSKNECEFEACPSPKVEKNKCLNGELCENGLVCSEKNICEGCLDFGCPDGLMCQIDNTCVKESQKSLKDLFQISKNQPSIRNPQWIGELKINDRLAEAIKKQSENGIYLQDVGSKNESIWIQDKNDNMLGSVRIWVNPNWQEELIKILNKNLLVNSTKNTFSCPQNQTPDGCTGEITLEGYPKIIKVPEAWCEENCQEYDYLYFQITEDITHSSLKEFFEANTGNAYIDAANNAIGVGCINTDKSIEYSNFNDKEGWSQKVISPEEGIKISEATEQNPIRLKFNRKPVSGGSGAPTCYSHFSSIEIID